MRCRTEKNMKQLQLSESYANYEHGNHFVGVSMRKFEWTPKYRYKMMKNPEKRALVEACIRFAASRWKMKIFELNVQPEHVHCTVQIPMTMSPPSAVHKLKGISSKKIFEKVPNFRKRYPRGHFWSRGTNMTSVGFVSIEVANEYVKNQDAHHGTVWEIC